MLASFALIALTSLAPLQGDARVLDVNAFDWTFDESRVVLGETEVAPITLRARRKDGTPLDIAPPTLKSSTGSLSAPVRLRPGVWRTNYTPPPERFPHVALLSAQIDTDVGLAVGFTAVPLWGKGQLQVKTKPSSTVVVSIGNLEFGPAKSNAKGIASVDIIAPPGPERAVARSTDEFGNTSKEVVDLGVPPFNRLSLIALDDVAAADGTGEAQLLLYLVDKKGEAMIDAPVEVKATVGGLKELPQGISPGLFRLRYGPGTTKLKEATVDVALSKTTASSASRTITLIPGGARQAQLTQSHTTLSAEADRQVTVVVELFDQAGNPVPPTVARAFVDQGRLEEQSIAGLRATYTWVLPARLSALAPPAVDDTAAPDGSAVSTAPKTTMSQSAAVDATGPAVNAPIPFVASRDAHFVVRNRAGLEIGRARVVLVPGPPSRLALSPLREMVGDGQDAETIQVTAFDVAGNPVLPTGMRFESALGELKAPTTTGATLQALFVATALPSGAEPQVGELRAALPVEGGASVTASAPVRVSPVQLPSLLLVGVGVVTDYNLRTYLGAGPELSLLLRLPFFDGQLHAGLRTAAVVALPLPTGPNAALEGHLAVPVWAEVQWRDHFFAAVEDLALYGGAAAGVTMSDRLIDDGRGGLRASAAAPTAMGLVGAAYPVGPGWIEGELHAGFGWPLSTKLNWAPMATGLTLRYRFEPF